MRTQRISSNMKSKRIIIIILVVFFFGLFFQTAGAEKFTSEANKESFCTCDSSDKNLVCDCTCQSSNEVNDCYVGWLINDPVCACCGDCTLNNFISLAINLADKLLQFLGVFALLFIVVGGIIWMTSGGSADKVKKGKEIIKGAIIGLVIVLVAFTIVRMVMKALGPEAEKYLPGEKCTIEEKDDAVCIEVGVEDYKQYKEAGTGLEDYICKLGQCAGDSTICCKKK